MPKYGNMIPEGTSDLLYKECEALRDVEEKMCGLFRSHGFNEVATPSLEFYDVFTNKASDMPQEMMYKLVDSKGRILVMRPDNTTPVARVVSSKLTGYMPPLRLYYKQNVFRINPALSGRRDEIPQCGIELIGAGGEKADIEAILTAVQALQAVAPDFRFEIGHVGFFKAIMKNLPYDEETREQIKHCIEGKNYASLNTLFKGCENDRFCNALAALPELSGGDEVFGEALKAAPNSEAAATVNYLHGLFRVLCSMQLENNVIIDFGLVHQINYYTGVVFRGYIQGSGEPVLSGGRYDGLYSGFGSPMPATGFALNAAAVARAAGNRQKSGRPDVILFFDAGDITPAYERMEKLTGSGLVCELSTFDTLDETLHYSRAKGIRRIDIVAQGGVKTLNVEETGDGQD